VRSGDRGAASASDTPRRQALSVAARSSGSLASTLTPEKRSTAASASDVDGLCDV